MDKSVDTYQLDYVHTTKRAAFAASLDPNICIPEPALHPANSISIAHRTFVPVVGSNEEPKTKKGTTM